MINTNKAREALYAVYDACRNVVAELEAEEAQIWHTADKGRRACTPKEIRRLDEIAEQLEAVYEEIKAISRAVALIDDYAGE